MALCMDGHGAEATQDSLGQLQLHLQHRRHRVSNSVAPGFKNKTRYTPYASPGSQISHIATNKGNINRQCSIYNVPSIKNITLDSK